VRAAAESSGRAAMLATAARLLAISDGLSCWVAVVSEVVSSRY